MTPAEQAYNGARDAFRSFGLRGSDLEDACQDAALAVLVALRKSTHLRHPEAYGVRQARWIRAQSEKRMARWQSFPDGCGWEVAR